MNVWPILGSLIASLLLASICDPVAPGARHSLLPDEIAQAIEWGRSGQPAAYPLRSAFPKARTTPGAVYTPYLRVALASRSAREEGRMFTARDVTPGMTAPLIYVAIGASGDDPLPPEPLPSTTPLSMRLVTEHSHPGSPRRRVMSAVWVRREVPAFLRYGLRPQWSYVFAAFPVDQVKADTRLELYRERWERHASRTGGDPGRDHGSRPRSVEVSQQPLTPPHDPAGQRELNPAVNAVQTAVVILEAGEPRIALQNTPAAFTAARTWARNCRVSWPKWLDAGTPKSPENTSCRKPQRSFAPLDLRCRLSSHARLVTPRSRGTRLR